MFGLNTITKILLNPLNAFGEDTRGRTDKAIDAVNLILVLALAACMFGLFSY